MTQTSFGLDLAGFDGGVAGVLGVEDARGAGVQDALVAGDLDDAALGGEVALEDDEAAGGLERVVDGIDDLLVGCLDGVDGLFGEGLAGDGDQAAVDEACVEEPLREEARAACVLVVLGRVLAAGGEVADVRRAVADGVEVVDGEGDVELTRDGQQVQHGVGAEPPDAQAET